MERRKPKVSEGGAYFGPSPSLKFISSGSAVLDHALGGGWVLGRMSNIIGDKSTAKTGLTVEACANFARAYPKGKIKHYETESAFDESYAGRMGYPRDRVTRWEDDHDTPLDTVEDVYEDIEKFLPKLRGQPGLAIVDSLDALSDRDEMKTPIDKGSYNQGKQKKLSQIFRRMIRELERSNCCLLIVSQVRHNIGVMFGDKFTRSGGKSLDFYASHLAWLANAGMIDATYKGVKRTTGIKVKVRIKKNKVASANRDVTFSYINNFGIDQALTAADWLHENRTLLPAEYTLEKLVGCPSPETFLKYIQKVSDKEHKELAATLEAIIPKAWATVEKNFSTGRRKYE